MADIDEAARAAVVDLIECQDAAWNAGDAAAFGTSALPNVVFTNVVGMFSVGVEPFIAQHAHIFATIYRGSTLRQELAHVTPVGEDAMIVDTVAAVTGAMHLPPGAVAEDGVLRTRLEQVLVRRDGAWRVQSFHNVPVNPAAVRAAETSVRG